MQKLAEICIRRPVFASMIVLSLVVVGAASYFRLGVDRFPSVDLPTVSIRTGLPGGSPQEVESLVTQQIEEVVNTGQVPVTTSNTLAEVRTLSFDETGGASGGQIRAYKL